MPGVSAIRKANASDCSEALPATYRYPHLRLSEAQADRQRGFPRSLRRSGYPSIADTPHTGTSARVRVAFPDTMIGQEAGGAPFDFTLPTHRESAWRLPVVAYDHLSPALSPTRYQSLSAWSRAPI